MRLESLEYYQLFIINYGWMEMEKIISTEKLSAKEFEEHKKDLEDALNNRVELKSETTYK